MEAPSGAAKPLSCPIPILDLMVFKGVDMYIIVEKELKWESAWSEYIALPPVDITLISFCSFKITASSASLTNLYPFTCFRLSRDWLNLASISWSVSIKLVSRLSDKALPRVDFPEPAIPINDKLPSIFSKIICRFY